MIGGAFSREFSLDGDRELGRVGVADDLAQPALDFEHPGGGPAQAHRARQRFGTLQAAALVGADLLREDSGFVATTLMGAVLANQRRIDVSLMLEFQGTLVQMLIGILFVLIAASVSPSDVNAVLPEALVLVAGMVLVIRPLAVALATWRSGLSAGERGFVAWMAPRGIVAGATASAFGLELEQANVAGAQLILPTVFVAIFGTVVLYGLTAEPVARLLGVARVGGPDRARGRREPVGA